MSDVNPNKHVGRDAGSGSSPWFHRGSDFPVMETAGDGGSEPADSLPDRAGELGYQLGLRWGSSARRVLESFGEALANGPTDPYQSRRISVSTDEDPCGEGYDVVLGYVDGVGAGGHRYSPALSSTESFPLSFDLDEFAAAAGVASSTSGLLEPLNLDQPLPEGESMSPERHPAGRNCAKPAATMMFILACLVGMGFLVAGQLGV